MKALGIAAVALAIVAAAAPAKPRQQIRQTTGFIEALALDGNTLAYDVEGGQPRGPACNRVYAWNLGTGQVTRVSAGGTCEADSTSTGAGVKQLAVAGRRLAWIVNTGGNTESADKLFTASLPKPRERKLASVLRTGDVDCVLTGRALGGLVGGGALLAYNIWNVAAANPGDEGSCATKPTAAALRRIGTRGTTLLRSGTDTLVAEDADAGRIAVAHDDGTVELFSSSGSTLRTIGVEPAREVALAGDRLLVLTRTRRIQVYSASTGRPGATHAVPAGAGHLEAGGGIAAYAAGSKLHVLRLASAKDTVIATAPKQIVDVGVSARAVAYAFNAFERTRSGFREIGNVGVIPLSR